MATFIPVWVPFVLLLLLVLGYRQSLARTVRPGTLATVALGMFGFSLYGIVAAFGVTAVALALWVAGYAVSLVAGARRVSSAGMAVVGTSIHIPGSWVPLALFVAIFAAKFAMGFATGVHSPIVREPWFVAAMSVVLGLLSGGFGARALAVHRFASSARAA